MLWWTLRQLKSSDPATAERAALELGVSKEREAVEPLLAALGGSHGADVTGGMIGKVQQMLHVVQVHPSIEARIFSGVVRGNVQRLLIDPAESIGTAIRAGLQRQKN